MAGAERRPELAPGVAEPPPEIIEAYRKIRNTLRYLASNLYDFDPAVDRVPLDRMQEVDRFALTR